MIFFRKRKRTPKNLDTLPKEVQEYFLSFSQKSTSDNYVVFDLETTGLDPVKDHILSFAFLKIKNEELLIQERFEGFLRFEKSHQLRASEIHQITRSETDAGITEEEFILKLLPFIGNATLVGHHVAFDLECINSLMRRLYKTELLNKTADTAKLGARVENVLMSYYGGNKAFKNLDSLCKDYHITPEARHSASGDTYSTALLFLKLIKKARQRGIKDF